MIDRKLVRMQEKGQVTIPREIRKKLGLKRGDLVTVMETPEGVFIPQKPRLDSGNGYFDSYLVAGAKLEISAFIAGQKP